MRWAYIALPLALSACHVWPSRPVSDLTHGGRTVRVVTEDGRRRTVLEGASVSGDSVVGRLTEVDTLRADGWTLLRRGSGERVAIATSGVTRIEVRALDKRRTFGPLAIVGAVAALTLLLAAALGGLASTAAY